MGPKNPLKNPTNKNSGAEEFVTNHFHGMCNSCSEKYEAQSQTDDLEGITFKCRKSICSGRVTLELNKQKLAPALKTPGGKSTPPRRYC